MKHSVVISPATERVLLACRPVADGLAKAVHVSAAQHKLGSVTRVVVQILCGDDHRFVKADDREHGAIFICPCCAAKLEGMPDVAELMQLRIGQKMRFLDGSWITTDGDA